VEVLRSVSICVRRAETVCVIGPSGSGKTTFLRCVNGLEKLDGGRISVNGEWIGYTENPDGTLKKASGRRVAMQRRNIGLVFQRFNLWPHLTALQNVSEAPVHVLKRNRADVREEAVALLGRVGLAEKVDAYPSKLSGGQQQRVAIARALAMHPAMMLFDEATSALDPESVGDVLAVMRELSKDGMTMLVVTHEMGFAREAADRVVMMSDGMILEDAGPQEIFSAPQHERTKLFIESILGSRSDAIPARETRE
jgi:polar amino acid transport system ATP-binding protein